MSLALQSYSFGRDGCGEHKNKKTSQLASATVLMLAKAKIANSDLRIYFAYSISGQKVNSKVRMSNMLCLVEPADLKHSQMAVCRSFALEERCG